MNASVVKADGSNFTGSVSSYTEVSATLFGPQVISSSAFAQKSQEFELVGTGTMSFVGAVVITADFSGGARVRNQGSISFTVQRRSGASSPWSTIASRGRSLDISTGTIIEDFTDLNDLALSTGFYRVQTLLSASSESTRGGVGLGEGLVNFQLAYYFPNVTGTLSSQSPLLFSNPVPEPFTMLGLSVGIVGILRRKKHNSKS